MANKEGGSKKLLILIGSPRRDGNTYALAEAAQAGALEARHEVTLAFADDHIAHFLKDCRTCRKANGECSLEDHYRSLFFESYLPADGVIFASPIYWYGMAAQLKAFFDRSFCYYAASYPDSDKVMAGMCGKRIGLLLASEETYPGVALGIMHQIQEFSRYTHSEFAGAIRGIGNRRRDLKSRDVQDSGERFEDSLTQARLLGRDLFDRHFSDYRMDTPRPASVNDVEA